MSGNADMRTVDHDRYIDRHELRHLISEIQAEHFRVEDRMQRFADHANNIQRLGSETVECLERNAGVSRLNALLSQISSINHALEYRSADVVEASKGLSRLEARLLNIISPGSYVSTHFQSSKAPELPDQMSEIVVSNAPSEAEVGIDPVAMDYFDLISRAKQIQEELAELDDEREEEFAERQLFRDQQRTNPNGEVNARQEIAEQQRALETELRYVEAEAAEQKLICDERGIDLVQERWRNADHKDIVVTAPIVHANVKQPLEGWLANVPGGELGDHFSSPENQASPSGHPDLQKAFKQYKHRNGSWFKKFRIFRSQWVDFENDDESSSAVTSLRSNDSIVSKWAKVRTFIVVAEGKDSCTCVEVRTYNSNGVAKPGVVKNQHAMLYARGSPKPKENELASRGEKGMRTPIQAKLERPDERLHDMARIDYSHLYQVPHAVRAKPVGFVRTRSHVDFETDFRDALSPVLFGHSNSSVITAGNTASLRGGSARVGKKVGEKQSSRNPVK